MAARNLLLYHLFHWTLLLDPVLFHAFFAKMQNKKFINKGGRLFCSENCDAAAVLGQKNGHMAARTEEKLCQISFRPKGFF